MLRVAFVRIVNILVSLSLFSPVYGADKFPDYPARPAGDYVVKAENVGVIVGVQPVENLKEQETYFHTQLTPRGFLPVFLVIQNGSTTDSFLFDTSKIMLDRPTSSKGWEPQVRSEAAKVTAIASVAALSLAGLMVSGLLAVNASHVQQNILRKEVRSKTLSPGTSVHGFVYIPVPRKGQRETIYLEIPFVRVGTTDIRVVNISF